DGDDLRRAAAARAAGAGRRADDLAGGRGRAGPRRIPERGAVMIGGAILFWAAVAMIVYPYLIYPAVVAIAGRIRPRPVRRAPFTPPVTVLIRGSNGAEVMGETIANKLAQDYPAQLLQIIVVSDGSSDGT